MSQVRAKQLRDLIRSAGTVLPDHEVEDVAKKIEQSDLPLSIAGKDKPRTVLLKAEELIHGDRLKHYGPPEVNFQRIATAWTEFLSKKLQGIREDEECLENCVQERWVEKITPTDVCMMMILLKVMRMAEGFHVDSVIDIGGYTALAAILAGEDEL